MRCKTCGGEIHFSKNEGICQNCGLSFIPNSAFENIDVCICYVDSDAGGRRTKDSIIAQEVYRKLEGNGINTFYERVSADGMSGDDLIYARYSAIYQAKVILVLGESVDNFSFIEKEYSDVLSEKTVIPFCVDISPDKIPKMFSAKQAVNYTTIGWEKDLIKGINRLLGKDEKEDKGTLYGNAFKKKIAIICATVIIFMAVATAFFLNAFEPGGESVSIQEEQTTYSDREIFDLANKCYEDGDVIQALTYFCQIPEYSGSNHMIKQIYSKYEGFFQKDGHIIHIEIIDNIYAEISLKINSDEGVTNINVNAEIDVNKVNCVYRDNNQESGNLEIGFEENGIKLIQLSDSESKERELFFELADRTDKPIMEIDPDTLKCWLDENLTYKQIAEYGYDLEEVAVLDRAGADRMYKIQYTDIYLMIYGVYIDNDYDSVLLGITAPAELILPSREGKSLEPVIIGDTLYCPYAQLEPGAFMLCGFYKDKYKTSETKISGETLICMVNKKDFDKDEWDRILRSSTDISIDRDVAIRYKLSIDNDWIYDEIISENSTDYLICISTENLRSKGKNAWYKANKKNLTIRFLREGPYIYNNANEIDGYIFLEEYSDFLIEFPVDPEECNHIWEYATCTTPETCKLCKKTVGSPDDHYWLYGTCTEPRTCQYCGETDGETYDHIWSYVSCTEPMVCDECGALDDYICGHEWITATCYESMYCSRCGEISGEPLEHLWSEATCETPEICEYCGEVGEYGLCSFTDIRIEDGETVAYCEVCGIPG